VAIRVSFSDEFLRRQFAFHLRRRARRGWGWAVVWGGVLSTWPPRGGGLGLGVASFDRFCCCDRIRDGFCCLNFSNQDHALILAYLFVQIATRPLCCVLCVGLCVSQSFPSHVYEVHRGCLSLLASMMENKTSHIYISHPYHVWIVYCLLVIMFAMVYDYVGNLIITKGDVIVWRVHVCMYVRA
jgi:hypothetical protein